MKQIKYTEVSIIFHRGEGATRTVKFAEDALAGADEVAQQILAKQDIRYTDDGATHIIKWDSVIMASLVRAVEDVAAPYDAICGGCEHPGAYLKLKDGVTFCYYTDADTGDKMANMYLNGNLVEAPYSAEALAQVCELTLDCEPLVATQGGIVSVEPNPDDDNYVVTFYAGDDEGTEATTTAVAPTACE